MDVCARRQVRQRVPSVLHLLLADDPPALALALAAAAEIEPQRRVPESREGLRDRRSAAAVLVAAEPVQDEKRRAALAARLGKLKHPRELEPVGREAYALFHFPDYRCVAARRGRIRCDES